MRGKFWLGIGLVVLATAILPSCNEIVNYPAPRVQALEPATVQGGTQQFTLTVTGFSLTPASTVEWNGTPLITIFQSVNALTAQVPASFVQNPGSVAIQVITPQPGGGTSTALIFTITPPPAPVPQISSISPSGVLAGGSAFQLLITGANFVGSSLVTVNGDNRAATVLNSTSIQVQIQAYDIAAAGTVQIAVVNPVGTTAGPGGSSAPVSLIVNNPVPTISTMSPDTFAAGTTASTPVSVTGFSMVPNSVIEIDGAPPASGTVFGSSTSLSTTLAAGDFVAAGIHRLQVVNPAPGGGASNVLTYAVNATLTQGLPQLLDYGYDGSLANQGVCGSCASGTPTIYTAGPSINSNGSVVVFASTSTNFLENQANTGGDIFSRTTCLTNSACTPSTTDVSVGPNKAVSNGSSSEPSVDSGGGHVAFTSTASNLVAGVTLPTGNRQVYWTPICSANSTATCQPSQLASLSPDGITPGNGDSYNPSISPDGRYVAFVSLATNLVPGLATLDGKTPQVFLRDTCNGSVSGCTPTTYLVSTPDGATPGDGASSLPSVANDGEYVSFTSASTNLGATAPNPGGAQEIFERTTCLPTVTSCVAITSLVSTPDGVTPANGASTQSRIASGGRFVAFASTATNLATGAGPTQQIYMYDTCLSAASGCIPGVTLVSTPDGSTAGNGASEYPTISLGTSSVSTSSTAGEFIAFASRSSNLASNTANGVENVFVRKLCLGFASTITSCTPSTALVTQPAGTSPPQANGDSLMPAISGDAHTVAFISSANNLVADDNNGFANLFLALSSF